MNLPATLTRLSAACAAMLFPAFALGDAAPPILFHELAQEGQDIKIVIEQPDNDWHAGDPRDLVRRQADEDTRLYSFILEDETPIYSGRTCGRHWYETIDSTELCAQYPESCHECDDDEETVCIGESCADCTEVSEQFTPVEISAYDDFCEQFPVYAVDCDEDGDAECCLVCETYLLFAMWDRCVPPGEVTYEIIYTSEGGRYTEVEDSTSFTVAESDQNCDPPSTDDPGESDTNEEPHDTGDSDGKDTDTEKAQDTGSDDPEERDTETNGLTPAPSDDGCSISAVGERTGYRSDVMALIQQLLID